MTETEIEKGKADRALKFATVVSLQVMECLCGDDLAQSICWPFGDNVVEIEPAEFDNVIVSVFAPFVRAHPTAPPEAMFLAARPPHTKERWDQVSLARQFAHGMFMFALVQADRTIAESLKRDAPKPAPIEDKGIPRELSTMERVDGADDLMHDMGTVGPITPGIPRADEFSVATGLGNPPAEVRGPFVDPRLRKGYKPPKPKPGQI